MSGLLDDIRAAMDSAGPAPLPRDVVVTAKVRDRIARLYRLDEPRVQGSLWAGLPVHVIPDGSVPLDDFNTVKVQDGVWLVPPALAGFAKTDPDLDLPEGPDLTGGENGGLWQLAATWCAAAAVVGAAVVLVWRWVR